MSRRLFSKFDSRDRGNEPIEPNVPVIKFKRLVPIVLRRLLPCKSCSSIKAIELTVYKLSFVSRSRCNRAVITDLRD